MNAPEAMGIQFFDVRATTGIAFPWLIVVYYRLGKRNSRTISLIWYVYPMNKIDALKIDKTAFSVTSLFDESDEKAYWLSRTPHERLEAVELMRQIIYGYDPTSTRLQRILNIAELTSG